MEHDPETGEVTGNALMERDDEFEGRILKVDSAQVALAKSEVESQLDAAHRYPRSIKRFRQEALSLATVTREVAESCMYALPRGGKTIVGPSVRFAEVCASAYGNLHLAARIVGVEDKNIVAQGGAWDMEKNLRFSVETRRRITKKDGDLYDDDMQTLTGNAAASIALRNAIFRVIPRAFIDEMFAQVKKVAVGDAKTLVARRDDLLARLSKLGADQTRVLAALNKRGVEEIGLEEIELLIGWGTSIKDGQKTVDDLFPAPEKPGAIPADQQGRRMPLGAAKTEAKPESPKLETKSSHGDAKVEAKGETKAEREPGSEG